MGDQGGRVSAGPRCIAIVGPQQSGKTTLLEALLARAGGLDRQGRVADGNTVGDASPEARAHLMSVEANVASLEFLGESYTFIDCPGSLEFRHDMCAVLPACDAAIVVCEADVRKLHALEVVLRELEEAGIPRLIFLNKVDTSSLEVRDALGLLQAASRTPLLMRQIPIWNDGIAVGFIDLALERAFIYREHAASEVVDLPEAELSAEKEARFSMLEKLADYDDTLMEALLEEIEPPRDRVFDDLARELREQHVVPVLIGASERGNGVTRLLKALRHEVPGVEGVVRRLGVGSDGPALAQVMKTTHLAQGGKLSLVRVLRGNLTEGDTVTGSGGNEARIAGILRQNGGATTRLPTAGLGDTVALARLEGIATGETLSAGRTAPEPLVSIAAPQPVYACALVTTDLKDDVRLTAALAKLMEGDPSLVVEQRPELGELRLAGQGEMHLRVALERLANRYGVQVAVRKPQVAYRETIRNTASARGRHKKQSGGHGQYGDVVIDIAPLNRGDGMIFADMISGGVIPRQYISSVEAGVREATGKGPLGFPVVDVEVTLKDGSYHTVDSSDMAFRAAARLALADALPKASPVLLEPVLGVELAVPSEVMVKITGLISARRGQILGYDKRPGWDGWDMVKAHIPEAEISDMIIELRSATQGVGTFSSSFDHFAELTGKAAEMVAQQAAHA
ncbi:MULTISPECIES: elongation factor G [unclassified Chelatococcus]|uniref:elongation factor G n=1 Tax=unclassified Chelatococcus TaxID=2638111 RepID=UPI001BCAAC33|nr:MULTISPECIES: elongation factor G [unclassified Chelatococcus]CAH1665287.1 Elongation factor G-like protein [Hyphomicrobiales bacterium]MBS7737698.1 elongation factor G [Chelatococcus sp. HY11]MBX3544168.1 elongation factor G [Chelatococcus sp.]MCO5079510.1 elongation factor G [Chelatococcus sp.]CAH1681424.1 Elongation factor G-like protein [Hyphomicrobiales bacterium]